MFVDRSLAKRLEMITARSGKECADIWAEIGGGIATFSGIDSPITQAFGVGLFGPVSEAELDQLGGIVDAWRFSRSPTLTIVFGAIDTGSAPRFSVASANGLAG